MATTYTVAEFKTHYSEGSPDVGAFTIADIAANLASDDLLGSFTISILITMGCTGIAVTDNQPISVSIGSGALSSQLVNITSTGPVIVKTDTYILSPHLIPTDLAQLVTYGVTGLDLTSNAVTLTLSQYNALAATSLRFAADDVVKLSAYSSDFKLLAPSALQAMGVTKIDAYDDSYPLGWSLTVAQAQGFLAKGISFVDRGKLKLLDTAINITGLDGTQLAALKTGGVSKIDVSDPTWSLSAAQLTTLQASGLAFVTGEKFTLSDTAANIQGISGSDLTNLKNAGATGVTVSDNAALTLSVAQAIALNLKITSTGSITVSGTGANIATITDIQLGKLAGYGVTLIDSSTNAVTLSLTQYTALKATTLRFSTEDVVTVNGAVVTDLNNFQTLTLTAAQLLTTPFADADSVTLRDTFYNIRGFSDSVLTNVDVISITDTTVTLALLNYKVLKDHGLLISPGQTFILEVSADDLKNTTKLADIKATGLSINVYQSTWSLSVSEFTAVKNANLTFVAGETFSVSDAAANIATADFAAIKAAGGTGITVSDNRAITLSAAKAAALGLKITSSGSITVSDTGVNIANITDTQLGKLAGYGVTVIDSTTNAVTLTAAQYNALKGTALRFASGDVVTVADTADILKNLDAAALQSFGVSKIDATDAFWSLSASQLNAFAAKGISLASGDDITLTDAAANVAGLSNTVLANIDHITLTDTTFSLTLAQFNVLNAHGLTLASGQTFRISDTSANIHNFTTTDLAAIKTAGASGITVSDNQALTLSPAQATALTLAISSTGAVTITDTSANLLTLIGAKAPSDLASLGIKSLDATDNAVSLQADQFTVLKTAGLRFAANDVVTFTDTANNLKAYAGGTYSITPAALQNFGVTKIDATDASWTLNWAQLSAFTAKGISLVSGDDITLSDTFNNIKGRVAGDLANIDHITITTSTYALTLAQHTLLKAYGWAPTSDQTVSLRVSAADLKDATQLTAIKTAALPVDVTDNTWSLTAAQFAAVNSAHITFDSGESFTLSDTAANLVKADGFLNLSVVDLQALTAAQASGVAVSDATKIYLTPDQAAALKFSITRAQVVSNNNVGSEAQPDANTLALIVKGTGAEIASKISPTLFGELAGLGVTDLNASDNQVSLSVAQYAALVGTSLRFDSSDAITLSSADLAALTDGQVGALKSNGVVAVSSTTTLSLSIAQYKALVAQNVPFTAGTDIIIRDTSAELAKLTANDITGLAANGVDKLDSTSGSLSLTKAQQDQLAAAGIGTVAGDTITTVFTYKTYTLAEYLLAHPLTNVGTEAARLVDTAANLAKLTPEVVGYFAADKVTQISATDTNLSITITQFDAIKASGVTYDVNNVVVIVADKASFTGFNAARLADFKANGVDVLGSNTPATAWTLTVAQYKAVIASGLGFAQGDTITLLDTAANLQTNLVTSPTTGTQQVDIRLLAANGVDKIETSGTNVSLSFSVDQAKNLGAVKLATTFTAIISDTADLISRMTGDQIAAASAAGFDQISATDGDTITLRVDQATKLGGLKAGTTVTLTDSGTNIARLTVAQINDLADNNAITSYNVISTGDKVSLTADQLAAIVAKHVSFADEDLVTLSDLAANIKLLSGDTIAGLRGAGVAAITVKDNKSLELNADQADALDIKINSTAAITLVGTGALIVEKIDADQMGGLKGLGFTKINVSDDAIALEVQQYLKLKASGLTFTTGDVVSIADTGENLKGLTAEKILALSFGINSIHATDDLLLSASQLDMLVERGVAYSAAYEIVFYDTAEVITGLSLDAISNLRDRGVVRIEASDDACALTVEQYQALLETGIALTKSDHVTLADNGINLATLSVDELNALYAKGVAYVDLQADGDDVYSLNLSAAKWQALFHTDEESAGVQFTTGTQTLLADSIAQFAPIATLLDTADAIEGLDAADLAAIAAQNVVIDSSSDALTLTWAQYQALAELEKTKILADGDTVTLSVADGDLPDLPAYTLGDGDSSDAAAKTRWLKDMGLIGVDIISAKDGSLTLTKAQYDALIQQNTVDGWNSHAVLKASDTFTLTLSKAELEMLGDAEIRLLSANGIDRIHVEAFDGGGTLSYPYQYFKDEDFKDIDLNAGDLVPVFLDTDQAKALGSLVIENASKVVLFDIGSHIGRLPAETLAKLVTSGFTEITASDDFYNFTVDQYLAVAGTACKLNQDDNVLLFDKADAIALRNPSQFAAMAGNGVDSIYTTDKMLSLRVEQAIELGSVKVDHYLHDPLVDGPAYFPEPYFQILDTAANISKLTKSQLERLNVNLLDQINSTEGKISLNAEQLMALDTIKIAPGNAVTLFDTGANIADIDFSKLDDIGAAGQTNVIDAKDNVLSITVDNFHDIVAATAWKLSPNDVVTLADTAERLADLTVEEISGDGTPAKSLAGRGIDILTVTNSAELNLSLAQYKALIATSCRLTAGDEVALKDITQNDLDGFAPSFLRALAGNGIDTVRIDSNADNSNGDIKVSVEKYLALGVVKIATEGIYTLNDGAGAIAALTNDQFAALDDNGVDVIAVSDGEPLKLTVEQYRNLDNVALTDGDTVILSDTVEHLNTLSNDDIAALTSHFVDSIEPTDGPFSLTLDKALVLNAVKFENTNTVTVTGPGADITALDKTQFANLNAAGVDVIDADDTGPVSLDVGEVLALGDMTLAAGDAVTLADGYIALGLLESDDIAKLGDQGVDVIDSTDRYVEWNVAQATKLGRVTLGTSYDFYIVDEPTAVEALSDGQITSLARAGLDAIDVGANDLTLTVAQANALTLTTAVAGTPVTYTVTQQIVINDDPDPDFDANVTLADSGANIARLSAREIGYLAAVGVDQINVTGDQLVTISVDQFKKLNGVKFTDGSKVTLADTAAQLKTLSADEIVTLKDLGVDFVNPTDATLDLTADKAAKLPSGVTFTGTHLVQIVDTGENIATELSGDQIAILSTAGVDWIDSNDNAIKLTVDQANKLGSIKIAAGDQATLSDTAANIHDMNSTDIAVLGSKGVDVIDANDVPATTLNLSVDQAKALGSVTLGATNLVQIQDTAEKVQGLSGAQLTSLARAGLDAIDVGANALSLTAAQANALTLTTAVAGAPVTYTVNQKIVVNGDADVTLADSGANIARLSAREIGYLAAVGVDKIDSTDADSKLSLSVAQYQALGTVALTSGDNVTLLDIGATISNLQSGDLLALAGKNIDAIDASDNAMTLTVAQYKALFIPATGVKLTGADVITLKDTGDAIANGLTADELAGLAANGVDIIDAYDSTAVGSENNLTLTVNQYLRLIATSTKLTASDVVTIKDDAAAIKGLTYAQIRELAANNVDFVDAKDVPLELTVGDARAFGTVKFGTTKDVIVKDAADVISATPSDVIQTLTANGVDRFVPITNYLRLTVAQAKNLGSTVVDSTDAIVLDSAENIQRLTDTEIAALARSGIDRIDVEDILSTPAIERNLSLLVDQYRALMLGGIKLTPDDYVTLTDTTDKIQGLTDNELSGLAGNRIDAIDVSGDGKLSLSVARYSSLKTVVLTAGDVVTLADTGDNIANLGETGIAALAGKFIDFIDVTGDGKLTLDIARYNALGTVKLTDGDTVTLADTAANWKLQDPSFFTNLNGKFVDAITVTDGDDKLALTVAQYRELIKYTKLTAGDDVTLSDTAANLLGLTVAEIQALKTNFVDHLDATNAVLDLPLAKATVIPAGVTFGTTNEVRVVGSGTDISALTDVQIAALAAAGVDKIDAQGSDQAVTLDLAKAKALGAMVFDRTDTVTLRDTPANLAADKLTPDLITTLGATNGVDVIKSTTGALSLTVDQYRKLIATSMKLTLNDVVTLSDTAENLKGLTTTEIAGLAINGVDIIDVSSSSDTTLDLKVEQVNVLPLGVTFGATKDVRIVDSGTVISGLSADRITLLNAAGLDKIDATDADPVIKLMAAKVVALGDSTIAGNHYITIASGDDVTLSDNANAIKTMALSTFKGLSAHGVDKIDATDGTLDLTVAQATANGSSVTLGVINKVRIADAGATISAMTEQQIKDLDAAGLDFIDADNNTVTLDAAKAKALGRIVFDASDNQVTLKDTAANFAATNLSPADITRIAGNGVDWILSSETNHTLALTVAQYRALADTLTTSNPLRLTQGDAVTLKDTADNLKLLSAQEIAALAANGVDYVDSSSGVLNWTVAQATALPAAVTFGSTNLVQIADTVARIDTLTVPQIKALDAAGLDFIDAVDAGYSPGAFAVSLSVDKAVALGAIKMAADDTVTLADSAGKIGGMSTTELGKLKDANIDWIDVGGDGKMSLTVERFNVLGSVQLTALDTITLSDTAVALKTLWDGTKPISTLATKNVDFIDVTVGQLKLTVAEAKLLPIYDDASAKIKFATTNNANSVQIVDTANAISTDLSADDFAKLSAASVNVIDAIGNGAITLDFAKAKALGAIVFDATDTVTMKLDAADLNAAILTPDLITRMGAVNGIDLILSNAADHTLSLNVDQYKALIATSMKLTLTDKVTLADTAAKLNSLSAPELGLLDDNGIDLIQPTDEALSLTVAKATSIADGVRFVGVVQIVDAGTTISNMSSDQIAILARSGLTAMDATLADPNVTLSVRMATALGDITFADNDTVTLSDYGPIIGAMSKAEIEKLRTNGVDSIDVIGDGRLALSVEKFNALGPVKLTLLDTVTLADTQANLQAIQAADLGALGGKGIDFIDSANDTLSLTAAKAQALARGSVVIVSTDNVTLADTGTETAKLLAADFGNLAGKGVDVIDTSDNVLSLTVDQYRALVATSTRLTQADVVTISDVGENLLKLTVAEITALKTNGVDKIDATDAMLDLPLDKANAIPAGVTFGTTNDVRVVGSGTAISGLSAAQIAALRDAGVDKIDAQAPDEAVTLDLAKAKALGVMVFDASDAVTLKDAAANLAAANLSTDDIARIAANGVDVILSSETNHTLALTVAQYRALADTLTTSNPLRLTPDDTVTLSDTAANLKGLNPAEIGDLATNGVDILNVSASSDTTLDFKVEQVDALPVGVSFGSTKDVRIVDTGTAISGLSAERIALLNAAGLDKIDATDADRVITLTAAKVAALGNITIASGDDVTLSDDANAIKTMALNIFQGLSAHGIDKIDPTDPIVDLSVAQATANGRSVILGVVNKVRIADTGATISAMTEQQITDLNAAGLDYINADNDTVTLNAAKAKALGNIVFDASDNQVTLKDTAANLAVANLSAADITRIAGNGVDWIQSDQSDRTLSLTVAQYKALFDTLSTANPLRLNADDRVTLSDTAANLQSLSVSQITKLTDIGVDVLNVSSANDTTLDLTVEQVNALPAGVTFGSTKDVRIVDTGLAISGLSAERIALLSAAGLDKIDATDADRVITLTAAKVAALGNITIASGDDVTLSDEANAIKTMALSIFQGLRAHGVDKIDATDAMLDLSVEQATNIPAGVTFGTTQDVRVVDTGAAISGLSAPQIAALRDAGVDKIDAKASGVGVLANQTITVSVAQAKALGTMVFDTSDVVTLKDTAANLAATNLSADDIARFAANGVDLILSSETNHTLSLTVAQYRALVATLTTETPLRLTVNDKVTLLDTAANLATLQPAEIAALATNGVDYVDSSSGVLSLTVAQATSLPVGVTFGSTNLVQIADAGSNISTGLSDTQLASLSAAGLDRIDANDDVVTLTALKAKALGNIVIASGDKVTLVDSGTNIASQLSAADFGKLAGNGVDVIDVNGDDKLSLSVDQYRALVATTCKLTELDKVTLSDTAFNLARLQPNEIAALATNGIDVVTATDATLSWTVAQATALPATIAFGGSYNVQIADTVANINTLAAGQIQALNTRLAYIDAVDSSLNPADLQVSLTADKAAALGSIKMAPGDIVTLADSVGNIGGLSTDQLSKLKLANIDFIDVGGDGKMSLTVERFNALGTVQLTASDTITLSDTAGALKTLWTANTISSLAQKNVDFVDVTDGPLNLTAAEARALPVFDANAANNIKFTTTNNANVVKIVDGGGSISTGLSASQIAALSAAGVNAFDATDNALSLSVDQAKALGGIVVAAGDVVTLLDAGSTIATNLSDVDIGKLAAHGVDRIDANDNVLSLKVAQYRALGAVKLTLGDTVTLADTAENLGSLSAADLRFIGDNGIDQIRSTDAPLTLSVSKATAISDGVSFVGANRVYISDAGQTISRMTADQIAILARAGLSMIDASDADPIVKLTVPMATALGAITFGPNDVVTLNDYGAVVGALSVAELGKLKDNGVNFIDANGDNKLSLSVDQFNALGSVKLTEADTVTLTDTQAKLEGLDAAAIALLGGKGIDIIDSSGDALTLSLAKLNALETDPLKKVALTQTDIVTLKDTQRTLESLDVEALRQLGGKGIDIIDSSGDALTLSLAKLTALEADANRKVSLTGGDVVTLADAKEAIQGLSATAISALAGKGVDIIDSTSAGDGLALRVDQYQSLGRVALTQGDTVSLVDTQVALENLDATAIGNLGANGVDILDSTGDVLNLSVAKFKALSKDPTRKVALTQADLVTLVDTGAEIAKLSKQDILDLGAGLVDRIDAIGNLSLTVEQYRALGSVKTNMANTITLADTAANLALLSASEVGLLGARAIDFIDSTDNVVSLSVDQYLSLGGVKLTASDTVSLADTATNLGKLSLEQLRGLGSAGVDKIDVTGNVLDWSLAQYKAAVSSVTFAADDKVTFENGRDFNHDGRSDILMQSSVNGQIFLWNMNGKAFASYGSFGGVPGTTWVAKGTGDFDNNGYTDILFQNTLNGSCYIWEKAPGADNGLVANNALLRHGLVGGTPGLDWKVVGTGDFNGDHVTDILFQNAIDGSCEIWQIDGSKPLDGMTALKSYGLVGAATGLDWKVKGVGDFNGDGVSDIVFQNIRNGAVYLWNIDGSQSLTGWNAVKERGFVGGTPGAEWQLKVVGDFNNDGKDDLLFQNSLDGSCYIWELDGVNKLVDHGFVGGSPGAVWNVVSSGDFNADGKSDVLFQNTATNEYYIWELNGTKALVDHGSVARPPSEWHAIS